MDTLHRSFPLRAGAVLSLAAIVSLVACGAHPPRSASAPELVVVGEADAPDLAAASEDHAAVPISADDAVRGSRLAPVTLVVFSDFQSPFDARLVPTLERLREEYGNDTLRIVFKNDPLAFHQHARIAAEVGQGVLAIGGQDAFWRYREMAFRCQSELSPEAARSWAVAAGVDAQALDDGLEQKRWASKVAHDLEVARRVGVCGAPTAFVNGVSIAGAQPYDKFKQLIDAELANAHAALARGTAPDEVYAQRTAANFEAPSNPGCQRYGSASDCRPAGTPCADDSGSCCSRSCSDTAYGSVCN